MRELPDWVKLEPERALERIAWAGMRAPEFDQPIITPFVIPTVLAALWCVLTNPVSWRKAVAAAIRLGGDVDTLGAIVGGLMGARLGEKSIPKQLARQVAKADHIRQLAKSYAALVESQSIFERQ